eukprot:388271_1
MKWKHQEQDLDRFDDMVCDIFLESHSNVHMWTTYDAYPRTANLHPDNTHQIPLHLIPRYNGSLKCLRIYSSMVAEISLSFIANEPPCMHPTNYCWHSSKTVTHPLYHVSNDMESCYVQTTNDG